jgi:glucuronoarabinoxylan endo-1,4-beta-xylanase
MSVTRRKFVQTISGAAALASARPFTVLAQTTHPLVEIQPRFGHQMMDGFGICEAFHMARNVQQFPDKDRAAILNLLFQPNGGMGFSILRNIIGDGGPNQTTQNGSTESIEPTEGVWNWTGDEDQIWMMNEAKARGCSRFLSCVWSPPAWMKENKSATNGGILSPGKYQAFADYIAEYVLQYKAKYNLDIYAISPANEPGWVARWASTEWPGSSMTKFLHENLIPTFAAKNVKAEIVIDEHNNWTDKGINAILSDPVCDKAINIVAAHAYASTTQEFMPLSSRTGIFQTAIDKNKRIWETEVSADDKADTSMLDGVYWARVVHTHLVEDHVSAWFYWWGAAISKTRGSLISLDMDKKSYQLSKRLFTIGQYARFIRPGSQRVNATQTPVPNMVVSAYTDPTKKKIIMVIVNDDTQNHDIDFKVTDFPITTCIPVRTSVTENHTRLPNITVKDNTFTASIPSETVTTYLLG